MSTRGYTAILVVRGMARKFKRLLWELFLGKKKDRIVKNIVHLKYVIFFNKFEYHLSVRAIKKRISRKFKI